METELKELIDLANLIDMPIVDEKFNPLACFIPYVARKEIVHTQILQNLLEYEKASGAKSFLRHFLPGIDCETESIRVIKERKVKRVLTEGEGDRSIDLCIQWKNHNGHIHSVIIENKLNDAYFQEKQIEDYQESLKVVEGENVVGTIVIYGNKNKLGYTAKGVSLISPEQLAEWVNSNFSDVNITAYSNYLNTMNNNNITMANALKLTSLTLEEIKKLNYLNEAFNDLNKAKNEVILNALKENFPNVNSTFGRLDEGCKAFQIWNEDDYIRNDLWIALFAPENPANDEQGTDLYLYGHAKRGENHQKAIKEAGYKKCGTNEGYVFYRSPLKYRFQFFDKESKKCLVQEICRLLEILKDR